MIGLIGKKLHMSQEFTDDGEVVPVTVVQAGPCFISQIKRKKTDGYDAIQIGFGEKKKANRPTIGHFKKANLPPLRYLTEIKVDNIEEYKLGQKLDVSIFKEGDLVDVTGYSKGRGFAGGVKRWDWGGGPDSHGSATHRRIGSAGATTFPGRTWKGQHMAGHYGNERITVKNLKVVKVEKEKNLLYLKGAVPGPRNGRLIIRRKK
ncbi:50S ribosomal protein L3 [candidate division WOR-3 bacterium]|uniref:Large ribosomal subunit protein uL3 n=1 Tax=candidate division WOR-3 bacterium TaxID=2052148 RepID=A0A660SH38_UNCW3|nr:MAG: 50S ribosomal protein L3 [candidate division WOR-3 bacterium]